MAAQRPVTLQHDRADAWLRARGWRSHRTDEDRDQGDRWTWPPTDSALWRTPTTIVYDGHRFRVFYAQAADSPVDAHFPMDYLHDLTRLQSFAPGIEAWPHGNLRVGTLGTAGT